MPRAFFLLLIPCLLGAAPPTVEELLESGHFLRAKQALQGHESDARSAYLLSKAEAALGNLEVSVRLAEAAVSADDANAAYHVQLAAALGRMAQTASMFKQLGLAKRAKKELDTALALDPKNIDALYGLTLFYFAAPSFLGGSKQKAQDAAEEMTRLSPARGYLAQARLAAESKDAPAEEQFYRKSLAADPQFYEAKAALATFYLAHDIKAAEAEATQALAFDPGRVEAWKVLAQVAVARQCWEKLLVILERAREAVPDDLAYYYSAACALEQSGRFLNWARDFLTVYVSSVPEGNEPASDLAEKALKRLKLLASASPAML